MKRFVLLLPLLAACPASVEVVRQPPTVDAGIDQEVAEGMGLSQADFRRYFGVGVPTNPSGSMPQDDGGDEMAPTLEIVADDSGDAPGDRLGRDELLALVTQKLTEQEYRIVYLKYWEELPMREIGQLTGLSESRVCKIHTRLIDRLRERFRVDLPS